MGRDEGEQNPTKQKQIENHKKVNITNHYT